MSNSSVWQEIEATLTQIHSLKHNVVHQQSFGRNTSDVVAHKLRELRSGFLGEPTREDLRGLKVFLRVVGPANNPYGEWWFDAKVLESLDQSFSRIFYNRNERSAAIRDVLREGLAISASFKNAISEVWALELTAAEELVGYSAPGAPMNLFAGVPLSEKGNRMLAGGLRQYYFPVKNPFRVQKMRDLL